MFHSRFFARSMVLMMVFVLTVAAASEAQAQRRRRRPRSLIGLAANEQVQKELEATAEQKTKIEEISDTFRSDSRDLFSGLQGLSREERTEKFAELRPKHQELAAAAEKKLAAVLKKDQLKRLREINIQVSGGRVLARDEIAKALDLSKEQKAKIKGVFESAQKRRGKLFQDLQSGNLDRSEIREKFSDLRKEINTEALAVLTKKQKAKFEKMKGEKFELES